MSRPSMNAKNSSGRVVSLLNDETATQVVAQTYSLSRTSIPNMARSDSNNSMRSNSTTPNTPGLIRTDSFDSGKFEPLSPITPTMMPEFQRQNSYTGFNWKEQGPHFEYQQRSGYDDYSNPQYPRPPFTHHRTSSHGEPRMYDEDQYQSTNSDRSPKRYPCRYKDSHGCDKTFTTSGHASRHSKIHTAEKAVACTFPGCQKKFTRSDNMKQHLETHTKERSRSAQKPGAKTLTNPAGIRKVSGRISRPSSRNTNSSELPPMDPALFQQDSYSSTTAGGFSTVSSPTAAYFPTSNQPVSLAVDSAQTGLDALAIAAGYQSQS